MISLRTVIRLSLVALLGAAACYSTGAGTAGDAAGATLKAVRSRGTLKCGIAEGSGFAVPDNAGRWTGFDVDFCRAIAVALFDDPDKVEFIPYTMQQRFAGLQSGEVDILVNGTSETVSRALGRGFHFGPVYLHDGQGFLVAKSLKVTNATRLDGATVCVRQGTTTELNLADFARRNGIKVRPVVIEDLRSAVSAVSGGRCDAITQDMAGLATTRTMLPQPDRFVFLPDRISKEPIAPVVRFGDDQWLEVINWVFWATMQAEEYGITQANVEQQAAGNDPSIRRFLGFEPGVTDGLGLDPKWPYNVIRKIGNYGEIFERHLGPKTPLGMPRGANRPWTEGGLLFSPPFR